MNNTGKKRMLKLADFLDKLPRKLFRFNEVRKEVKCGTVACAMGWTPSVFPHLVRVNKNAYDWKRFEVETKNSRGYSAVAEEIFDLDSDPGIAHALFTPGHFVCGIHLGEQATPKQVAKRLRKYVAMQP